MELQVCLFSVIDNFRWFLLKKELYGPYLWMRFNCLKARATSSPKKFLALTLSTSEGWKAESILMPPSGFEHRIPGFGIQRLPDGDGKSSQDYPVIAGVPQCSILGPTLFLLYINDLPDDIIFNIAIYADNTTLYPKCDQVSDLWQLNLNLNLASELESALWDTVD